MHVRFFPEGSDLTGPERFLIEGRLPLKKSKFKRYPLVVGSRALLVDSVQLSVLSAQLLVLAALLLGLRVWTNVSCLWFAVLAAHHDLPYPSTLLSTLTHTTGESTLTSASHYNNFQ